MQADSDSAKVEALGYLGIESERLEAWRDYAAAFLGLMPVDGASDGLLFRGDEQAWRLRVDPGPAEDLAFIGFSVTTPAELDALAERLTGLGFDCQRDDALAARRQVAQLLCVEDPDGVPIELYCAATRAPQVPMRSPAGVTGFVMGEQGFGHVVLYTKDAAAKSRFFTAGLGFRRSDTIRMNEHLELEFLHCNARHHTVALAPAPVDKRLNHFMLQAASLDDVGFALDRAKALEVPFTSSLGRHTNDQMTSFYTRTPSGFEAEFGFGGVMVDEHWSVGHYTAPSIWGHERVR
ncbi:MAG: VOC family protein [Pseudomonadota bacterium]